MALDSSTLMKAHKSASSLADLCESYCMEPSGKATRLDPVQRSVFNVLEYGDDIELFGGKILRVHHYVIMCWPRQTGKTYTISKFAAVAPLAFEDFHVGCYGPHELRSRIMLRKIKDNLKFSHFYSQVNWKEKSKTHLSLGKNSTIDSFNTSELQIKGDTEDVCLLDEADFMYDPNLILDAIEPKTTIPRLTKDWGKMLLISTPNMQNADSVFKQWYYEAVASRKVYCKACGKVKPISDYISMACPEDSFTVFGVPDKIDNCSCGTKSFVYFYDSDKIVIPVDPRKLPRIPWATIKAKLDARNWDPHARQEYLGEIIEGSGGMFPLPMLQRCEDYQLHNYKWPPKDWNKDEHNTCAGLDYGKLHDRTVISIMEKVNDYRFNLVSCHPVDVDVDSPTWDDIRRSIEPILTAWDVTYLVPDATGIGNESSERMKRDLDEWKCNTAILSNKPKHTGFYIDRQSKLDMVAAMEEKMKAAQFFMPPLNEPSMKLVRQEFMNFGYEVTKAHNIIYKALKGHDDMVISIMLANMGFKMDYVPSMKDFTWGFKQ